MTSGFYSLVCRIIWLYVQDFFTCILDKEDTSKFFQKYKKYRDDVRERKISKTTQYWILHLDLMRLQHQIHTAVQINNFDMRLDPWDKMLPMHFALNKTNYARYGTWYIQTMKEIDDRYPGLKPLLQ